MTDSNSELDAPIICPWCGDQMFVGGHRENDAGEVVVRMWAGCETCMACGPEVRIPIVTDTGEKEFEECRREAIRLALQREHRPDDDEPLTEQRLLAFGARVRDDGVLTLSAPPEHGNTVFRSLEFWQGRLCEWWYCSYQRLGQECDRVAMPRQSTCGDLRRLCKALGVPLEENDD